MTVNNIPYQDSRHHLNHLNPEKDSELLEVKNHSIQLKYLTLSK